MLGISKNKSENSTKNKDKVDSDESTTLVYSKPKILLVDLPKEISKSLESKGFNVSNGTFGSPYKVEVSNKITPIIERPNIPNISEQEVIFIDLTPPPTLDEPNSEYVKTEENQVWAKCNSGVIDPRQLYMYLAREPFDRILNHGGFFIIFAQPRVKEGYKWGKYQAGYGFVGNNEIWDNWSFLSILNNSDLLIESLSGEEINIKRNDHEIYRFLKKNIENSSFTSIFNARYGLKDKWVTLLKNKFGHPIGGLIFSDNKGKVLILPQLPKTPDVILTLLNEVLPELSPHLFPDFEGAKWVQRDKYELESIKKLKQNKIEVKGEAEKQLAILDEKIYEEREKFGFLHGILTKTGDELVADVEKCLDFIGFENVRNVDKELEADGKHRKQEDLQICDRSPSLLVEIKGISNHPKDEDILQVHKYIPRRMREWSRTDVSGVSLINYQKNLPAFERAPIMDDKIEIVDSHEITFVSTVDLFVLIRGMIKWGWDPKVIRDLFYEIGKIPDIPSHYIPIGEIFAYIKDKNIIGVNINSGKLYKGQKIGYKINNEFFEEEITSLEVDNHVVEEAFPGKPAGIKTIYSQKELKGAVIVYEVN